MRTGCLEMIQLSGLQAGDVDAPDVAPSILVRIEVQDLGRFCVVNVIIKQQPHFCGVAAEDNELHPGIANDGAVGQHVSKLKLGLSVSHMH